MLWLPHLRSAEGKWRLPLADASAPALLAALTEGASERAAAVVASALEDDAALALWALTCAALRGKDELRSIPALADWLARGARHIFVWTDGAEWASAGAALMAEYQRLQDSSRAAARRARERSPSNAAGDQAFLVGLLHRAERWWDLADALEQSASAAPVASEPSGNRPSVPRWLAESMGSGWSDEAIDSSATARNESGAPPAPSGDGAGALVASLLPEISARFARLESDDERFQALLETEKLAALAEFAAGAGHEINNPIAVISGRAQLLLEGERDPERRRELAVINTQAMRVYEMISDLMLFARPPKPQLASCDLAEILDRVIREISARAAERHVVIERQGLAGPAVVRADANQIVVAMRALCDNALGAMVGGGRLTIAIDHYANPPEGVHPGFVVTVRDTGPGISREVRRHLFDPFYSGRPAGRGLGMGLAKCWRIIASHGGSIDVASEPGRGARFTVYLPATASVQPACT